MNLKAYLLAATLALFGCQNAPTPNYERENRQLREENNMLRGKIESYDSRIAQLESSTAASVASYQSIISQLGGGPATIVAERRDRLASEAYIALALLNLEEQLNLYASQTRTEQTRTTAQQAGALEQLRGNLNGLSATVATLTSETRASLGANVNSDAQRYEALRLDYQQKIDALERRLRGLEAHLPTGPAPSAGAQEAYERATRGSAPRTPR